MSLSWLGTDTQTGDRWSQTDSGGDREGKPGNHGWSVWV